MQYLPLAGEIAEYWEAVCSRISPFYTFFQRKSCGFAAFLACDSQLTPQHPNHWLLKKDAGRSTLFISYQLGFDVLIYLTALNLIFERFLPRVLSDPTSTRLLTELRTGLLACEGSTSSDFEWDDLVSLSSLTMDNDTSRGVVRMEVKEDWDFDVINPSSLSSWSSRGYFTASNTINKFYRFKKISPGRERQFSLVCQWEERF